MRLVHHVSHCLIIALLKCVTNSQNSFSFANYIVCTESIFLTYFGANLIQHLVCGISQTFNLRMFGVNGCCYVFAALSTVIIGRTYEFMFYARVYKYQFVAFGVEWVVFKFTTAAVKTHEASCFTVYAGELVHDTAVYTDVFVFCTLSNAGQLHLFDFVVAPKVVKGKCINTFKGCG